VSYLSTTSYTDPTRVFSNFLEFKVDATAPCGAANENDDACDASVPPFGSSSWTLVNNWAAGLDYTMRSRPPAFDGFHAVAEIADGRTLGFIELGGGQRGR
jgi:hypothetical protein